MKFLSNEYVKVFCYKGFDICTLKTACPEQGNNLGYVIDDYRFSGRYFNLLDTAISAIDAQLIE
ncbi:hypothetical protein [Hungatella sp.]|jgi:hypothetical protein|uniref:hypothetical protein n=1 Tax=Hungatella sp. TaxID=2613924 RepID=UPI002A8017CA|nr:hypothetical protein [Hungatella sp.]